MKAVAFFLLLLSLPALLAARQPSSPKPLAFMHVTVIDGTGAKPRDDQIVVITGDRITALGSAGRVRPQTVFRQKP